MRKIAVVVDVQNDFCKPNGALYVPNAENILPTIENWLANLNPKEYSCVIFTQDSHDSKKYATSEEAKSFPKHCIKGTAGWDFAVNPQSVPNGIGIFKIEKNVFDMWQENDLVVDNMRAGFDETTVSIPRDEFFKMFSDSIKATVVGVASDYCVKWAVQGLVDRNYIVEIPKNCVAGIGQTMQEVVKENWANKKVTLVD